MVLNGSKKSELRIVKSLNTKVHIHSALINRCKTGDSKALNEVYNLYSGAMYAVSNRIVNDRMEAEDILQESFISAFKNLDNFRSESSFGAWIKRIVINKSLNHVKKRKIEFSELNDDIHGEFEDEEEETTQESEEYTINDIKKAVKNLPTGFRLVFTLYMFEDYSHQQIAEKLNISISTSKSQLHRSKAKLKELILMNKKDERRQA